MRPTTQDGGMVSNARAGAKLIRYRWFVAPALAGLAALALVTLSWTSRGSTPIGVKTQARGKVTMPRKDLVAAAVLPTASKVPGFEVAKLEKDIDGGFIYVWLRNDTGKAITGYVLADGIARDQTDLLTADQPQMLPNGEATKDMLEIAAELEVSGVTILAAMFEDGTTIGDPNAIDDISQWRRGVKIQCDHSASLLSRLAELPEPEMTDVPSRIDSELPALSTAEEAALPSKVRGAYHYQIDLTRHQMQHILEKKEPIGGSESTAAQNSDLRQTLRGFAAHYQELAGLLLRRD
jgi:hypothetical protein